MVNKESLFRSVRDILPNEGSNRFGFINIYPKDLEFDVQNRGEIIFLMMRKHFITNFAWIFQTVFTALIPLFVVIIINVLYINLNDYFLKNLVNSIAPQNWIIILLIYYLSLFTYAFGKFLDWYYNIYLVTNERIIHLYFKIFTGKVVSEANLDKIEDISQQTYGFFPSIFNYGDVYVQTAAERSRFMFKDVADPSWFRDILGDLANLVKDRDKEV